MRTGSLVLACLLMSACTGMLVGGGDNYDADQRDAATVSADDAISAAIKRRLADHPVAGGHSIAVRSHKGTVTLSGSVSNYSARNQAGRIAGETDGVVMVNNQIVVEN